nr:MAG TPA: PHB/PHA accumulation regulator DNA-binding domain [Caudoviricetes sp.]
MSIEKIKTFEEFKKELDFETTKKLTEIFQMIAKKDGFKATNAETGKDISDEVIENEIGMERIDIESIEFLIYKEWKKWWRNV